MPPSDDSHAEEPAAGVLSPPFPSAVPSEPAALTPEAEQPASPAGQPSIAPPAGQPSIAPPADRPRPASPPGTRWSRARPGAAPAPAADPELQKRAAAGLFLAMLSLAGLAGLNNLTRGVYVVLYALLAGAIALWLSVTALARARRRRTAGPRGAVTATVIAGVGISLSAVMLLAFVIFGSQLSSYGRCLSGANTIASQQTCQDQFFHAVAHKVPMLGG